MDEKTKNLMKEAVKSMKKYTPQFMVGLAVAALAMPYMAESSRRSYVSKTIEEKPIYRKHTKPYSPLLERNDWMCESSTDSIMESYNEYQSMMEFE